MLQLASLQLPSHTGNHGPLKAYSRSLISFRLKLMVHPGARFQEDIFLACFIKLQKIQQVAHHSDRFENMGETHTLPLCRVSLYPFLFCLFSRCDLVTCPFSSFSSLLKRIWTRYLLFCGFVPFPPPSPSPSPFKQHGFPSSCPVSFHINVYSVLMCLQQIISPRHETHRKFSCKKPASPSFCVFSFSLLFLLSHRQFLSPDRISAVPTPWPAITGKQHASFIQL